MVDSAGFTGKTAVAILAMVALMAGVSGAGVNNGSFETGDLTGWTAPSGNVAAVTSHGSYSPVDGTYFAVLAGGSTNAPYSLSQQFTASAGDILAFNYFWDSGDYVPYDDWGKGSILDATGGPVATLFSVSIGTLGDYVDVPWTPVSYTFATGGTFTLTFEVANSGDYMNNSFVGVDDVTLTQAQVPVPGAVLLGMLGLSAAGVRLRRYV